MEGDEQGQRWAMAIDSRVRERLVRTVSSATCEIRAVLRTRIVLTAA
ncbi:hypothetical protein ABT299_13105 [Spirillospora sp. NPDC000708]